MNRVHRSAAVAISVIIVGLISVTQGVAEPVGTVSLVQGTVSLARGNVDMSAQLDFGSEIDNFDQITTGNDGVLEISLEPATGFDATIKVQPNTTFTVEVGSSGGNRHGILDLMDGSVGLKVAKLDASSYFDVRTSAAIMGIRGTQFDVTTAVSGDILVSVQEGSVSCQDDTGTTLYAEPERAVEKVVAGDFRTLVVGSGGVAALRQMWMRQRIAAFRADGARIAARDIMRYRLLKRRFDSAYAAFLLHRAILDRWLAEDRERRPIDKAVAAVERARIARSLLALRRVDYLFSRSYHRLIAFERYYQRVARWKDTGDVRFNRFFAEFDNEKGITSERLRTVRYAVRMFVERGGWLELGTLRDILESS